METENKTKYIYKLARPDLRFPIKASFGFTLIELLVVIAIIALLASVVLVALNSARMRSRDAKRVADLNQVAKGMELFFDDKKSYPTAATWTDLDDVLYMTPTYMVRWPIAPTPSDSGVCMSSGNCTGKDANYYCYQGSANAYTITFCLGNSIAGGLSAGYHTLTQNGFR